MAGVFRSAGQIEVDMPITGATTKIGYGSFGQRE